MKKKNLLYIVCALAMGSLCGCDDFLNKDPQDKQTNDTYWQTETSLRTYAQDFYSSYFTGYGTDYTVFAGYFSGDDYTDDFINLNNANTNGSGYIYPLLPLQTGIAGRELGRTIIVLFIKPMSCLRRFPE